MLSYQHLYHAGSLTDVHKHMTLVRLLQILINKDRPISYMETHAGRGMYDLSCAEAQKTGEAAGGIEMILANNLIPEDDPYIKLIHRLRTEFRNPNIYPGSPLIAQKILRDTDRMFLMELHPGEVKYLYKLQRFGGAKPHIHHRDGYEGVLAITPPEYLRGLVLIDPSYEVKTEYQQVVNFVAQLTKKWPQAVIMIWYPILQQQYHLNMKSQLEDMNLKDLVFDEILFNNPIRIQGSGVAIINQPWGMDFKSLHCIFTPRKI